ncbi:predicted protein [Histoplasma mississippiense (nom. inval.)]|uniref:predicted protein n=1 Tax=Ajellomyces capsulatus (strain NAm1 / WU24) TaxID=2059318 RepID=UPI000157C7DC|nr:predicted protein [Histoplasma mississippiense (nom. inval.)]EDN09363.1 predicted protein [Histoplasma mississippiense (nom. inval.)]
MTSTGVKRKRSVSALLADIPPLKSIRFKSMESPHRSPTANLPNIDPRNPYTLFSLYISESDIQNIACSTNAYAEIQISRNSAIQLSIHGNGSQLLLQKSRPESSSFIQKLEPLYSNFHAACRKYYNPGSNLSIDEMMIRFFGRSKYTVKMPQKPIKQGYKVFGLGEQGYLWTFSMSNDNLRISTMFRTPGLTKTGSLVVELIERLPVFIQSSAALSSLQHSEQHLELNNSKEVAGYSIYMDNYFTSVALFHYLRKQGIGACGTTRPANLPPLLQELKNSGLSAHIPFNTLCIIPQNEVLCLGWKDNNIVLLLSTIHMPDSFVERVRKRPGLNSTNGPQIRRIFGDNWQKAVEIPTIIDDYNHNMNGIDLANQYRASYETHMPTNRTWLTILYWIIDHAIVNAYILHRLATTGTTGTTDTTISHVEFRRQLYIQLLEFSNPLPTTRSNPDLNHQRISLPSSQTCAWYYINYTKTRQYGRSLI